MVNPRRLTAIIYREGAAYIGNCPEVGTFEQGRTPAEAFTNLEAMTKLYLQVTSSSSDEEVVSFSAVSGIPVPGFSLPLISGFAAVRILQDIGFSQVRGYAILQKDFSSKESVTAIVPLHRELQASILNWLMHQAQISQQEFLNKF